MKLKKTIITAIAALSLIGTAPAYANGIATDILNVGLDAATGRLQHRSLFPSRMEIGYAVTGNGFGAQAIGTALSFLKFDASGVFMNYSHVHDGLAPTWETAPKKDKPITQTPSFEMGGKI